MCIRDRPTSASGDGSMTPIFTLSAAMACIGSAIAVVAASDPLRNERRFMDCDIYSPPFWFGKIL